MQANGNVNACIAGVYAYIEIHTTTAPWGSRCVNIVELLMQQTTLVEII